MPSSIRLGLNNALNTRLSIGSFHLLVGKTKSPTRMKTGRAGYKRRVEDAVRLDDTGSSPAPGYINDRRERPASGISYSIVGNNPLGSLLRFLNPSYYGVQLEQSFNLNRKGFRIFRTLFLQRLETPFCSMDLPSQIDFLESWALEEVLSE